MVDEVKGKLEKKKRRWLFRVFAGCVVLGVLLVALVGAGLFGVYVKRVEATNALLKKFVSPVEVSIEGIDREGFRKFSVRGIEMRTTGDAAALAVRVEGIEFEGRERVVVRGIEVRTAGRVETTVALEEIDVGYRIHDLRDVKSWTVDSVVISKPIVVVDAVAKEAIEKFIEEVGGKADQEMDEGEGLITDLLIGEVRVEAGRVDVTWGELPRVVFGFDVAGEQVRVMGEGPVSEGALKVTLRELEVGDGIVRLPVLDLAVALEEGFRGGRVEAFALDGLEAKVSPEVFAFLGSGEEGRESEPVVSKEVEGGGAWILEGVTIAGGKFSLAGFDGSEADLPLLPDVRFELGGELKGLRVEGGKVASASSQRLEISNVEIAGGAPGEEEAIAGRIESIVVEMVPDELIAEGVIGKLHVDAPAFEVTPASVARFIQRGEKKERAGLAEEGKDPGPDERKAIVVRDLAVNGGVFSVDPQLVGKSIPVTGGQFGVAMREGDAAEGDVLYRATVGGMNLKTPGEDGESFLKIQSVGVDFSALGLQGGKRIDAINVQGIRVVIDSALQEVFAKPEGGPEPAPEVVPEGKKVAPFSGWTLGSLDVGDTRIRISDLLPDIPPISFEIEISEDDLTLGDDRSETGETMRKVEVPKVEIPSPRNTFVKVADLRNIFIEFTLKGLLDNEIELIHVADPRVFVGEHLFWYIDYTRKFNEERAAAAERDAAGKVVVTEETGWKVKKLVAENGKLVLAPKGYPIPGIQPFPFNVATDLESGEIDMELIIEDGTYTLSKLGVELTMIGLKGKAIFNVPILQVDNNLWQYFYVDKVLFRDYEAANVELAVTYYEGGMSATFGGFAYEGYVNGGVDVFIGEKYSWVAWLSGANVNLNPITQLAAPDMFLLDTTMSAQIVAAGVGLELGLGDIYLSGLTPGRFEITKLNEILKDLPPEWSELKKQAVGIGVERLRDFEFDEGSGGVGYFDSTVELKSNDLKVSPYFEAIDFPENEPAGFLTLDLKGEEGLRSFQLDYYDRTAEKKANRAPLSASNE